MVGGGDDQALTLVGVKHLQDCIHDSAQLSMLECVLSLLAQGIELVKENDGARHSCEIEQTAQIGCSLAKERRNNAVSSHDRKKGAQVPRRSLRQLSSCHIPGGPQNRIRSVGRRPCASQDILAIVFKEDGFCQGQVRRRQNDIFELPSWHHGQ